MWYHTVRQRLELHDGDQRDGGSNVHVPLDPEILRTVLRGQTFLWEVKRGKEKRGFLSPPPHALHVLHLETCSSCSQVPSSKAKAQERNCKQLRLRNTSNLDKSEKHGDRDYLAFLFPGGGCWSSFLCFQGGRIPCSQYAVLGASLRPPSRGLGGRAFTLQC